MMISKVTEGHIKSLLYHIDPSDLIVTLNYVLMDTFVLVSFESYIHNSELKEF